MNWGAFDDLVTLSADFKYSTYSVESVSTTNQPMQPNEAVTSKPAQNNRQPESTVNKK
jgi:hypothetical protein